MWSCGPSFEALSCSGPRSGRQSTRLASPWVRTTVTARPATSTSWGVTMLDTVTAVQRLMLMCLSQLGQFTVECLSSDTTQQIATDRSDVLTAGLYRAGTLLALHDAYALPTLMI